MKHTFILITMLVCMAIHTNYIQASSENGSSGESCDTAGSKECSSPEWDDDKDDDSEETCEGDQRRCYKDEDVEKVKDADKRKWIKDTIKEFNKSCGKKGRGRKAFKNCGKYVRGMRKRRALGGYKTGRKNRRRLWVNLKGLRKHFARACADFNMTINYIIHCDGEQQSNSSTESVSTSSESTTEDTSTSSTVTSEGTSQTFSESTSSGNVTVDVTSESTIEVSTKKFYDYGGEEEPAPEVEDCDCNEMNRVIREVIIRRCQYFINYTYEIDVRDMDEINEASVKNYLSLIRLSCQIKQSFAESINDSNNFTYIQAFYVIFVVQINFVANQLNQIISIVYTEPSLFDNSTLSKRERKEEVETGLRGEPVICEANNTDGITLVMATMAANYIEAISLTQRLVTSRVVQEEEKFLNECEFRSNISRDAVIQECDHIQSIIVDDLNEICANDPKMRLAYGPNVCNGSQRYQLESYFKIENQYLRNVVIISSGNLVYSLKLADAYWQYVLIYFYVIFDIIDIIIKHYTIDGGNTLNVSENCSSCTSNYIVETRLLRIDVYKNCTKCAEEYINSTIHEDTIECMKKHKDAYEKIMNELKGKPVITKNDADKFHQDYYNANYNYTYGGYCGNSFTNKCVESNIATNNCKQPKIENGGKKRKETKEKCDSCRSQKCD